MSKPTGRPSREQIPFILRDARGLHGQGKLNDAERLYKLVLEVDAQNADALQFLGILLCQKERVPQGLEYLKKAVTANPDHAEAHANFGVALQMQGRLNDALPLLERATELDPNSVHALNSRGFVLFTLGRFAEALPWLERAIGLDGKRPDIRFNYANLLRELGEPEEAEVEFKAAIRLAPTYGEAYNNLGSLYTMLGRLDEAEKTLKLAIQVGFRTAQVLSNLAVVLHGKGQSKEAEQIFRQAIQLQPGVMHPYQELAAMYHTLGKIELSAAVLEQGLRIKPNDVETIKVWARVMSEMGRYQEARTRLVASRDPVCRLLSGLTQPTIAMDTNEILVGRQGLLDAIEATPDLKLRNPHDELRMTPFFLAYQGLGEKELVSAFAAHIRKACPTLNERPAFTREARKPGSRIRVGVATSHFRAHTIHKIYAEMVMRLDKDRFDVIFFDASRGKDPLTQQVSDRVSKTIPLALRLDAACTQIEAEKLDVLFYPELGMDNFIWYLAQIRLARKQIVTWGHPMTTGSPAIDAFLSSEDLETSESDAFYTERLIRTKTLNTYFLRPTAPDRFASREDLGLPTDKNIYACPQSLFKLHPSYDKILGEILRRDPKGLLVLLNASHTSWDGLLKERFAKTMPDVADRVQILSRLPFDQFLSLCHTSDALLDPTHFGGGTTTLEFFSIGAPVVNMRGDRLRNRITNAIYAAMEMDDLVADSDAAYVDLALKLATDRDFQKAMSKKTLERSTVLYGNQSVVAETERVFEQLADEAPTP